MNRKRNSGIVFAAGPMTEQGGPAEYVREIGRELSARGYRVETVRFSLFSTRIPGLRHLAYLLRLIPAAFRAHAVIAIDTWSVGIPAFIAAKLAGSALIIRVGGDFLWEHYVRRTGTEVKLSDFYRSADIRFTLKERIIYGGTRFLLSHADCIAFNTEWQKNIWQEAYALGGNARVVENRYPPHASDPRPRSTVFVSAGRASKIKNAENVQAAFAEAQSRHPGYTLDARVLSEAEHEERLRTCHALIQGSLSDIAPNAVIKAAAFGTPFICTTDTGIQERLEGRGLFVDTLDRGALVRAIESLMDDATYESMRAAASMPGFVRDWDQVTDDFESILRGAGLQAAPISR